MSTSDHSVHPSLVDLREASAVLQESIDYLGEAIPQNERSPQLHGKLSERRDSLIRCNHWLQSLVAHRPLTEGAEETGCVQ